MFGRLSSKTCAALLFAAGLAVSLILAYRLGSAWSWEQVLAAVERTADAVPSQRIWQQNMAKLAGYGAMVFCLGAVLSFLAAELYYFTLEFFKRASKATEAEKMPGE